MSNIYSCLRYYKSIRAYLLNSNDNYFVKLIVLCKTKPFVKIKFHKL